MRSESGFSLTELTIVLVIVSLLIALAMPVSTAYMTSENRSATTKRIANIQTALVNFTMANRRLPCSANGTLAFDHVDAGKETRDGSGYCTSNQASGVVPWRTLGMSAADGTDAWGNQITYRVGYTLTLDNMLDMSACDPAGTKAASAGRCDTSAIGGSFVASNYTAPAQYLTNKGLNVSDGASTIMDYTTTNGAAYVLISHGENRYGALVPSTGVLGTAAVGVPGNLEAPNQNTAALTVTAGVPPTLNDAPYRTAAEVTTYFDDIVAYVSVISLVNKAQLGPRAH